MQDIDSLKFNQGFNSASWRTGSGAAILRCTGHEISAFKCERHNSFQKKEPFKGSLYILN